MKNRISLFGIIIFTMIIMFTVVSCSNNPSGTYSATEDDATVTFIFSGKSDVNIIVQTSYSTNEVSGTYTVSDKKVTIVSSVTGTPMTFTIVDKNTLRSDEFKADFKKVSSGSTSSSSRTPAPAPASTPAPAPAPAPASTPSPASSQVNEAEPNDDYETAQLINIGSTIRGNFSHSDDKDLYKFVLTEPGTVTISSESNLDIYTLDINIYDEDGWLDDWIRGDYISGNRGDRRAEARLEPGNYAIEIEGYEAGDYSIITQFAR